MSEHTPAPLGPLHATGQDVYGQLLILGPPQDSPFRCVAKVGGMGHYDNATYAALARLFAGSPDLLEAAKEARDELEQYLAPWAERLAKKLGAAIEKAEEIA